MSLLSSLRQQVLAPFALLEEFHKSLVNSFLDVAFADNVNNAVCSTLIYDTLLFVI